jgi:TM2 domain-containing membrane protein YozV
MRGQVLDLDQAQGVVLISGQDGNRYQIQISDWPLKSGRAVKGCEVDFVPEGNKATDLRIIYKKPAAGSTSRGLYIVFGLFFGCLGVHDFYAQRWGMGILHLVLLLLAIPTAFITTFISYIIIFFEFIIVTHDASGRRMSY